MHHALCPMRYAHCQQSCSRTEKLPGKLLPAGLRQIAKDVISEITTIRGKGSGFLLDHLVKSIDLPIKILTRLLAEFRFQPIADTVESLRNGRRESIVSPR